MAYRILVVGAALTSVAAGEVFGRDEPQFAVSDASWMQFSPDLVREQDIRLVILPDDGSTQAAAAVELLDSGALTVPTIVVVPPGSYDSPLTQAADDFVEQTTLDQELRCRALRLLRGTVSETATAAERLGDELALRQLVGSDPAFVTVLRQIRLYARTETPVLILGETGTGKELCARALHHLGPRRNLPFVAVDCSSLPDHLFENEMFGHIRGAYTDAASDQKGLVALSDRGTLFLDEIDSLSLTAQGKLLRFLQDKSYRPLGGEKFLRANVHVIAATNANLETAVGQKQFRADLYYRLNVLQIRMPPLRERRGDIPQLARHFLQMMVDRIGVRRHFTPATLRKLAAYSWPGNIRELSNLVQRAAVLAEGESILPCHIVLPAEEAVTETAAVAGFRTARRLMIESFERSYVKSFLEKHGGNVTRAAREADYERRAFGRLAKKYDLTG